MQLFLGDPSSAPAAGAIITWGISLFHLSGNTPWPSSWGSMGYWCWHIFPALTHSTVWKTIARGTAQAEERRVSLQPKRQDNHQETEDMVASHSPEEEHQSRPVQVMPKTGGCPVSFTVWSCGESRTPSQLPAVEPTGPSQVLTLLHEGKNRHSVVLKQIISSCNH